MKNFFLTLILLFAAAGTAMADTFEAGKGAFMLNGEPFVVKAAELHYPRIPQPYWENRIELCKALGMNTICLYVFWNVHEGQPDVYDFEGQNDLRKFIELCQKHDMKVILRPGPYVCAEWEMGGLPWWLLKEKDIRLREDDPYFLERMSRFEEAVAQQVGDLTITNGGPIIMVQVENEYGSYGTNKPYVAAIRDMLRPLYPGVTLFQCDWASNFTNNGLDDLVWTMNFGTGADIDNQFEHLKELRPDAPLMCSEFWSGWFDKWGANHETRPADAMIAGIDEMLDKDISFSLYMTHGGTNWGHWAGANSPGFAPDVTSYDYDAPISESGQITPKYRLLRQTMARHSKDKLPPVPKTYKSMAIKPFALTQVAPLFANLPTPQHDRNIKNMEAYDQGYGSIIYSTTLPPLDQPSTLKITDVHDYARIFVDGQFVGKLDRRLGEMELRLPALPQGARLDILVEAMGRINFGRAIKDLKGITEKAEITTRIGDRDFVCDLKDWDVYLLPDQLDFYANMQFQPADTVGVPGVYRGTFTVGKPADTFLDFSTWGKGLVYVNGHALGRIWGIGPQQTLYMPGCWLREGENEILVFDIVGPRQATVQGMPQPIIDSLQDIEAMTNKQDEGVDFKALTPIATGTFAPGNGWQTVLFDTPATGRYFGIEALSAHDGGNAAAIAELYLLDKDGKRLSREPWTPRYATSEDAKGGNHTLDKAYDLQESTYWQTAPDAAYPHAAVIDLGSDTTIYGLEILPRMETSAPASISQYRLFVY